MSVSEMHRLPTLVLLLTWGCGTCGGCDQPYVALLEQATGRVEAGRQNLWREAVLGERFADGDWVRTGPQSSAVVRFENGGLVRLREESTMRFGRTSAAIDIGEAEIEGGVQLSMAFGLAVFEENGRATVRIEGGRAQLKMQAGQATIEGERARLLMAGQSMEVELEPAEIEDAGTKVDADVAPDAGSARPSVPEDLSIEAGESAIVHDTEPPTGVTVKTACDGRVQIRGQVYVGRSPTVSAPRGRSRYVVFCGDERAHTGRIEVRRDSGAAKLPKTAPENEVDADGRRYKVFYQSRLPSLTFRWPRAPKAARYTLVLGNKKIVSKTPEVKLRAGEVREGTYEWYFESSSQESGSQVARSPKTRLVVAFDNDAPVARILSPRDGTTAGEKVDVRGVAIRGASVSVRGNALEVDRGGRFDSAVALPPGLTSFAIRVEHRRTGVHYYVRHLTREETRAPD